MQEKLIDVSTWNGNIDWDKVYKSGVRYAMIRSSFGIENPNQIDNKFVRNIENAIKVGIKCGIYHYSYARSVAEAKKEADFCLKTIKNYKIDLPVAFDIEDSSQTNLGKDALTSIVIAFCDRIKSAGYTPMLYCNPSWLNSYLHKDKLIGKYDLWLCPGGARPNGPREGGHFGGQRGGRPPREGGRGPAREAAPRVWQPKAPAKSDNLSFEDMMSRFKSQSEEKMADLDHETNNRRGGGYAPRSRRGR